jgi:diadenosine tetraphosphate (Ap4A) HIT family hydrolase
MMYFNYFEKILPADLIYENDCWNSFYHPKPDYPLYILILPKQGVSSLLDASNDSDAFYAAFFQLVRILITAHDLGRRGYRLITNGGANQSIPQWHWHLVSEYDDT